MKYTEITPEEFLGVEKQNATMKYKEISPEEFLGTKDVKKNTSFMGDMWSGHVNNINKYVASIQKMASKGAGAIGLDKASRYLEEASKNSSDIANDYKKRINNQVAGVIGEMVGDPLNLIPVGGAIGKARKIKDLSKLEKAKDIGKEALKFGAFSSGASMLSDYGDSAISSEQMKKNALLSGAVGATIGGSLASGLPQQLIKKGYNKAKDSIDKLRGKISNPIIDNVLDSANPNLTPRELNRIDKKEMARVHQVLENKKPSTIIRKYDDSNKDALIFEKGNKKYGAKHIQRKHLGSGKKGEVSKYDIMSLGQNIRNNLQNNIEPTTEIDSMGRNKKLYEWEKDSSNFRAVTRDLDKAELDQSPANFNQPREKIISFYSDKNLKEPMEFHTKAYQDSEQIPKISKFNLENLKGIASNQAGSAISGAGVGATINADYDSKGDIDWASVATGAILGAGGGLAIKNAPKIIREAETLPIKKELDSAILENDEFLKTYNDKQDKLQKRFNEVEADIIPPEILEKNREILEYLEQQKQSYKQAKGNKEEKDKIKKQMEDAINYRENLNAPYTPRVEEEKALIKNEEIALNNTLIEKQAKVRQLKEQLKDDKDFKNINGVFGELRGAFTNTFSDDFNKLRDKAVSNINKQAMDIEVINKMFSGYDKQTLQNMGKALQGEDITLGNIDNKLVASLRDMIDNNTKELHSLGFFDTNTLNEYLGNYTIRNYDLNLKDKFKNTFKAGFGLDNITKKRGEEYAISLEDFKKGVASGDIVEYGSGGFSKGKKTYFRDKDGKILHNQKNQVIIRQDLSKARRAELKEDTDISIIAAKTLMKQRELIEHAKYLQNIKDYAEQLAKQSPNKQQIFLEVAGDVDKKYLDSFAKQSGFTKLDSRFGVLEGKYIRKDIANDLNANYDKLYGTFFGRDGWGAGWKNYLNMWKKSKTVYNSKAHINNLASNASLMILNGFNPTDMIKQANVLSKAKTYDTLLAKQKLGIINETESKTLLDMSDEMKIYKEAYDSGLFGRGQIADVSSGESTLKGVLGKSARFAESAYKFEDNVARLSTFSSLRKKGYVSWVIYDDLVF
ncbi:hypothetical protein F1B92_00800 [Campylobacter sp. FMV-PI01]|uniref:Large polyvalent protein associated domain-containing protein n=1 Tax=Campylobacter portucalensis TaxID=2608384 RepID=A0A6L5WIA3_9BACT|nr:hypothetical protein [Campylobacter portucalensis]MSN95745.1 hypothetical protein [Campylobacter portucalensis]